VIEDIVSAKDLAIRKMLRENNERVEASGIRVKARDLLLLLPHCIQVHQCPRRVNVHSEYCTRCGKCPIGKILNLKDHLGFQMALASGGGLARLMVHKFKPKFIIASACENDLESGVNDVKGIPVWAILITRPSGPCFDTQLIYSEVEQAMRKFISDWPADYMGAVKNE